LKKEGARRSVMIGSSSRVPKRPVSWNPLPVSISQACSPSVPDVISQAQTSFGVIVSLRFTFFARLWENKTFNIVKFPIFELLPTILSTKSPNFPNPANIAKGAVIITHLINNEFPEMSV